MAGSGKGALLPRVVIFLICFALLAGMLILSPPDDESSHVRLGKIPLPYSCSFKKLTKIPCPGCGLGRSLVLAAHGKIAQSLSYHRLGLLFLYYICLQFVYSIVVIAVPRWRDRLKRMGTVLNRGFIVLFVLLGLNWMVTLILLL
jgi:hypothetical protein